MIRRKSIFLLFFFGLSAQGCASRDGGGGALGLVMFDKTRGVAAAEPLFAREDDACLSDPSFLISVATNHIYPSPDTTHAIKTGTTATTEDDRSRKQHDNMEQRCTRLATQLREAANPPIPAAAAPPTNGKPAAATSSDVNEKTRRNEIIDALIAASNRKCGRYVAFLKTFDGNINSTFGIASIISGGLSSFIAGEATAKALGGTSAIFSGVRETYNQAHFANQTVQVLAVAFEQARQQQRESISNYQQCTPDQYTLMRGFEDAFRYHASCSIVFGLAEALKAVQRSENPDLDVMIKTAKKLAAFQHDMDLASGKKDTGTPVAPTTNTAATTPSTPKTSDAAAKPADPAAKPDAAENDETKKAEAIRQAAAISPAPSCPFSASKAGG